MKPTTPEQLVQAIQDHERKLPWNQRPTRREALEALLECYARAVAERDAEKRERAIRFTLGNLNASRSHQTTYEAVAEAYDRLNPRPTPAGPQPPPRG